MRVFGGLIGILVVMLIGWMIYKNYLVSGQAAGTTSPVQTIDAAGAQMDLLGIAQAERMYQAQHGKYASLDELVADGAMQLRKPNRQGYTYDVVASDASFQATARCTTPPIPGCHNYSIGPTMTVQVAP